MNDLSRYLSIIVKHAQNAQSMGHVVMFVSPAATWRKWRGKFIPILRGTLALILVVTGSSLAEFSPPVVTKGPASPLFAAFLSTGFFRRPTAPEARSPEPDRVLFEQNCTLCHTTELVRRRTRGWDRDRIRSALDHLNRLNPAMPDYKGTSQEKDRLADYIFLLNKEQPPDQ